MSFWHHFGLSTLAANFLNFQIKMMAERNTDWEVINDHYKKRCPLIPEKLVDKDSNNILAFMTQRLPMKVSVRHGFILLTYA